ncbi:MAG: diadenylate cyclase CdaA [Victivallales bacterium]|nr:diadenylate cyclase CdaA [Victivallales bacterium]
MSFYTTATEIYVLYLRPILEIGILTLLIYSILYHLRGTRGANILAGFIMVMALMILSDVLQFEVINWLLANLWAILATALIVIFQPELRRAFAQLGSTSFLSQRRTRRREAITEVAVAVTNMAKRRIGAIIVFERQIGMGSIVEDSINLDVRLNSYLIESIFFPNSPLHDGAIIIKDDKIIAAHSILPLSQNEEYVSALGTRHRAALGITEETDAVALVISEETGTISIACRGRLKRDIPADRLVRYLSTLLMIKDGNPGMNNFVTDDEMSIFTKD